MIILPRRYTSHLKCDIIWRISPLKSRFKAETGAVEALESRALVGIIMRVQIEED